MKKSMPAVTPAIAAESLGTSAAGIEMLVGEDVLEVLVSEGELLILESEVNRLLKLGCTRDWVIFWDECPDCGGPGQINEDDPRDLVIWFELPTRRQVDWVYTDHAIGTRA